MRRVLVALLVAGVFPAGASAATVSVQFQAFSPVPAEVLPGETVEWDNVSERTHTVTADDGSFDSGDLDPAAKFSVTFASAGTFAYHCTKHPGMTGEVDVEPVILDVLPTAPVPAGDQVEFEGRTSDPSQPIRIERSTGGEFQTIGTAQPAADGSWKTSLAAQSTGDYRAAVGSGVSGTRHLIVSDRKLLVKATRTGVSVTVVPALPYARIALQQDLRERFGWWPVANGKFDYVSSAEVNVKRPARVRLVLVDKDGWTTLATSSVLTLGHVHRRTKRMPAMPMH
jgi:plastocyanin